MNKLIGMVMAAAKLNDGAEVEIRFDHFHYRAYNAEEQQVGPERVNLDALMTEIGGVLLTGARSSLDIAAGGFKPENAAGGRDNSVLDSEAERMEGAGANLPEAGIPGPEAQGAGADVDGAADPAAVPAQQKDEETGDPRVH